MTGSALSDSVLVGVLCSAIAVLAMSTVSAIGMPELGATAVMAGLAGSACMVLGQS